MHLGWIQVCILGMVAPFLLVEAPPKFMLSSKLELSTKVGTKDFEKITSRAHQVVHLLIEHFMVRYD